VPIVQRVSPGGAKGLPRIPGARPSDIGRAASSTQQAREQAGKSIAEGGREGASFF